MKYVDQDGCERVNVSSGTGLPGCPGQTAVKWLFCHTDGHYGEE